VCGSFSVFRSVEPIFLSPSQVTKTNPFKYVKISAHPDLDLFAMGPVVSSLCHRNECKSAALTSHPQVQLSAPCHRMDLSFCICTWLSETLRLITPPHSHLLWGTYSCYTADSSYLAQICNYNFAPSRSFLWRRFPFGQTRIFCPVAAAI